MSDLDKNEMRRCCFDWEGCCFNAILTLLTLLTIFIH